MTRGTPSLRQLGREAADGIEIAIPPRPKMQIVNRLLYSYSTCFARLHGNAIAMETGYFFTIHIKHFGKECKRTGLDVLVANLRFGMDGCLVIGYVEIGSIDIGTCCA